MGRHQPNAGLTLVELLLLLGIFACLGIMVLPALLSVREAARRQTCARNLGQWGIAFHGYAYTQGRCPPSSEVSRDTEGKITALDGWSWMALCLPYLEQRGEGESVGWVIGLAGRLDLAQGQPLVEPAGSQGSPHAKALATRIPGLVCPSYGGSPWADPATRREAITNYKTLGATHFESLSVASPTPLPPKYSGPDHPDGVCFPGKGIQLREVTKGTSNTFLAVESLEPRWARWTVGAEAAVVALPRDVELEESEQYRFVPKGYYQLPVERYDDDGLDPRSEPLPDTSNSLYWTYHTYLDWDYDRVPYDGADGTRGGKYGPSSHHPGVVNHLLADASVLPISKWIDVAVYGGLTCREYRH